MDAKELRIGSYLQYKNTTDLAIVELIHKKHFDCRDEYGTFSPNGNYEPILLTEEWLLKMGFSFWEFDRTWRKSELDLQETPTKSGGRMILVPNRKFCLELKHVHQLQNLYFALTGEELTIKTK